MKKQDLIKHLAEQSQISQKQVEAVLSSLSQTIYQVMQSEGEFNLPDVGKFSITTRAARNGINPKTRETIKIPAKKMPKFTATKALKLVVAQET